MKNELKNFGKMKIPPFPASLRSSLRSCESYFLQFLGGPIGDIEDEREIVDVDYEDISSTTDRPAVLPDNQ